MKKLENVSKCRQLKSLVGISDRTLQSDWIAHAANWSIQKSGVAELRNKQQLSPDSDYMSYSLVFHNLEAQVTELRLHILHFLSFEGFVLVVFLQTTSFFLTAVDFVL